MPQKRNRSIDICENKTWNALESDQWRGALESCKHRHRSFNSGTIQTCRWGQNPPALWTKVYVKAEINSTRHGFFGPLKHDISLHAALWNVVVMLYSPKNIRVCGAQRVPFLWSFIRFETKKPTPSPQKSSVVSGHPRVCRTNWPQHLLWGHGHHGLGTSTGMVFFWRDGHPTLQVL